jgi:hypothetical protein
MVDADAPVKNGRKLMMLIVDNIQVSIGIQ